MGADVCLSHRAAACAPLLMMFGFGLVACGLAGNAHARGVIEFPTLPPPTASAAGHAAAGKATSEVTRTVNSAVDTTDGSCDDIHCTLREAIAASASGDIIQFSSLFATPQVIRLTGALPALSVPLTINGPGADRLTVRRETGGNYRIFRAEALLRISGLTIENGRTDFGGGVLSFVSLIMSNCVVSGNAATTNGSGVYAQGKTEITGTTFTGNVGPFAALFMFGGDARLYGSTISGNATQGLGAAVAVLGPTATLLNSTIYGNTGAASSGLLVSTQFGAASAYLANNAFSANQGPSIATANFNAVIAAVNSAGSNLSDDGGGGFLAGGGDQINTDARLYPLASNGGLSHPRFLGQ